jgi:group I intron endonuclease
MFYYLYEIRNNLNGKIYVGVHKTKDMNDGYMGSGKLIQFAIKKYGVENFTKTILEEFITYEEMFAREKEVVNEEFLKSNDVYNLRRGGFGGFDYINTNEIPKFLGKRHTEETKNMIRESSSGRTPTEETRSKLRDNSWSKKDPEAQKKHASEVSRNRQKGGKPKKEKDKIGAGVAIAHKNGKYSYDHLVGNSNNRGKRWVHRGNEQKMIPKSQLLPDGWSEKRK